MELKSNFLPEFKVQQPKLTCLISSNKRDSTPVIDMFTRETFPAQYYRWKHLEVHCNNDQNIQNLGLSKNETSKLPELSFDRLQLTDQECTGLQRRNFGRFVARGAILDEEYWEFYALKRRCFGQEGKSLNCFCLVAVKKEEKNVRRTVLNSIVGTLDLSIRQFVQGETYPEDIKRYSAVLVNQDPLDMHKYAYIANVCVAKFARRQGIASNMIYLATDVAIASGMKQLFVHVNADNRPAQDLYRKTGFKVIEAALSNLSKDQRILMSMDL
ncbi:GCN5-related N-acetyltransferase 6, chloroplastic-like isoform X2 [Primulina tabacum]|uniref:GCN5-related N-acetyltransferase 6, chloroplastic-like isoform X2 n=1 Tax=Primulina tabacum TaxID=48773 RepID=UPI003F5A449A